ncbi:hypothetical protein ONS95_002631 [Cadophora gregata]|uniref:uncharacterized protein n=1 Tax=Cadophora gregata TaxID=51156 RepID=UPI0026DD1136|nr:uncharacterized protein ONS95_002631 [Cadophora gregata]KAK0109964.1 hypothetical protein ONS95_002631 [Cadophora gregata]KAK0110409.1 hypothetical protein ONS96_002022 [Cadophora gregata f. sp. sojae]
MCEYAWALMRAHIFGLLLLSTCNFNPDHINDLPTELLNQIFRDAAADLPSLSKVSRRFHGMAQPQLYKNVSFGKEPQRFSSCSLLLFMRTISTSPDLAKKVKSLEMSCMQRCYQGADCGDFQWMKKEERVAIENICMGYVQNLQLWSRSDWTQELKNGTIGAFTQLLLLWLPNLVSISLQGQTWDAFHLLTLISRTVPKKTMFPHLKHLDLRCKSDHTGRKNTKFAFSGFRFLLRITSLRSLTVDMDEPSTPWPAALHAPREPSTLTSLEITLRHEENIGTILHLVPYLQKLTWKVSLEDKRNLSCDILQTALLGCSTLQKIRIIPKPAFGVFEQSPTVTLQGTISFIDFHHLRNLEIPFSMLLGWGEPNRVVLTDVLPKCLHHLIVLGNRMVKHQGEMWGTIGLLNVLRPYLVDVIHGQGPVPRELKTLTSRIGSYQSREHVSEQVESEYRPVTRLNDELRSVCKIVGVEFNP